MRSVLMLILPTPSFPRKERTVKDMRSISACFTHGSNPSEGYSIMGHRNVWDYLGEYRMTKFSNPLLLVFEQKSNNKNGAYRSVLNICMPSFSPLLPVAQVKH